MIVPFTLVTNNNQMVALYALAVDKLASTINIWAKGSLYFQAKWSYLFVNPNLPAFWRGLLLFLLILKLVQL